MCGPYTAVMKGPRRVWLVSIACAYLVGALLIGLWPTPVDAGLRTTISRVFAFLHHDGLPDNVGYSTLEFTANIAFFVPIGLLLALLLPRHRWWLAIVLGAALSGMIELSQLLLLPARYASWNDILANSTGAVIGVALVLVFRGVRWGLSPERRARRAESARGRVRSLGR